MKNRVFYGILAFPLAAFSLCGYILWRWGSTIAYAVVVALDVPIVLGMLLKLWRENKAWHERSTPIPSEDPLYQRTNILSNRMGVPMPRLYIADPELMVRRKVLGAVTIGIRTHSIMVDDLFIRGLSPDEQDAILAHELAHTKNPHALRRLTASLSYPLAGWNLFISAGFPNPSSSNVLDLWISRMAVGGLTLFLAGIIIVRPYFITDSQAEADEIAVKVLGSGDALISGLKKLVESVQAQGDQKRYRLARRGIYGRLVRIQELSRNLAVQKTSRQDLG